MNICHFLISGGFGGIERQVHSLTEEQSKKNSVGVIFGMRGGIFEERIKTLHNVSTTVLNLKNGVDLSLSAIIKAIRFIEEYDIIHIHSINYVILVAAVLTKKKIIFTFHGITHLRRKLGLRDRFKYHSLSFFANHVFCELTAVSLFMKKMTVEKLGIHKNIKVVYNITPSVSDKQKNRLNIRNRLYLHKDNILILSYGRIVHNKRMEMLLDAAAHLKCLGIESVKWLIIGDGPEKASLIEKASAMNLQTAVTFLGFKSNIFEYINAADLCVFPFRQEPFGIVALEAMTLGKPAFVMMDSGGLVEVISPVNDCYYVAFNVENLCNKIIGFVNDPGAFSRDKEAFIRRARDFEPQKISMCYEKLYRRVNLRN
ncbi:hypothetical protein JCM12296A_29740 [Desulfosarcina cetonica]